MARGSSFPEIKMFATIRAVAVGFAVLAAAFSSGAMQARATGYEQLQAWCDGRENVPDDVRISSCTAIINSGGYDAHDLNQAYYYRGYWYANTHQYERAIADFTQAIRYDPRDVDAYWLRYLSKKKVGDIAGAEADKKAAKRLDPTIENQWVYPP
jgi:tetratricopeptide (TPR) repeat protein